MKKITAAVLSVVLLAGCGSAESKALEIDAAELGNHITYYEVTPENWEEYFEWSKERVYQTDAFGDQRETTASTLYYHRRTSISLTRIL